MSVAVGYNNQVEASEAAQVLGCGYSTIVSLLAQKKLKGQKINKRWFVDHADLQRAKATQLVKPRNRPTRQQQQLKLAVSRPTPVIEQKLDDSKRADLKFSIDKEKLNIIQLALSSVDKTVAQYVSEKLDELHNKVRESLKTLRI